LTATVVARLVRALETKAPWGLRRAVERDRKSDDSTRPAHSRPDRETFRFFELRDDSPALLESLIPGEEVPTAAGPAWLSLRKLDTIWPRHPDFPDHSTDRMWFDIETQGGRGNPGFLFGACFWEEGSWWLWQALARSPDEEPALLHMITDLVKKRPRLVSYSGSKNDWPFLLSRWTHHRMPAPTPTEHLDLFDRAQILYRGVLPSCRLVTLEHHLCGRWREADLPSGYIPIAYLDWLENRDGRLLAQVLFHNALDVISLLELEPFLEAEACPLPIRVVEPSAPPAPPQA
jgi:uncharacterized protein YprB with RNaseH-like and TPR domain